MALIDTTYVCNNMKLIQNLIIGKVVNIPFIIGNDEIDLPRSSKCFRLRFNELIPNGYAYLRNDCTNNRKRCGIILIQRPNLSFKVVKVKHL